MGNCVVLQEKDDAWVEEQIGLEVERAYLTQERFIQEVEEVSEPQLSTTQRSRVYISKVETSSYIYEGEWLNKQRDGFGTLVWKHRPTFYKGDWVEDMAQGHGLLQIDSMHYYEGGWHGNRMQGKGKYVS
jgi:hypothetical protein